MQDFTRQAFTGIVLPSGMAGKSSSSLSSPPLRSRKGASSSCQSERHQAHQKICGPQTVAHIDHDTSTVCAKILPCASNAVLSKVYILKQEGSILTPDDFSERSIRNGLCGSPGAAQGPGRASPGWLGALTSSAWKRFGALRLGLIGRALRALWPCFAAAPGAADGPELEPPPAFSSAHCSIASVLLVNQQ